MRHRASKRGDTLRHTESAYVWDDVCVKTEVEDITISHRASQAILDEWQVIDRNVAGTDITVFKCL